MPERMLGRKAANREWEYKLYPGELKVGKKHFRAVEKEDERKEINAAADDLYEDINDYCREELAWEIREGLYAGPMPKQFKKAGA